MAGKHMFFAGFTNSEVNWSNSPGTGLRLFIKTDSNGNVLEGEGMTIDTPNNTTWTGNGSPQVDGLPPAATAIAVENNSALQFFPLANVGGTTRNISDSNYPGGLFYSIGALDVDIFTSGTPPKSLEDMDFSNAVGGGFFNVGSTLQNLRPGNQVNSTDIYNLCCPTNQFRGETVPDSHGTRAIYNIATGNLAEFFLTALDKATQNSTVWGRPRVLSGYSNLTTSDTDEKVAACLLGCGYGLMKDGDPTFVDLSA